MEKVKPEAKPKAEAKPKEADNLSELAPENVDLRGELEFKLRQAEGALNEYSNSPEGRHKSGWVEKIRADIHKAIWKVQTL